MTTALQSFVIPQKNKESTLARAAKLNTHVSIKKAKQIVAAKKALFERLRHV